MSIKCISSHLLTNVLTWRNPQGAEERWVNRPSGIDNRWRHIGKVATAEVGSLLLTAVALIETVAYAALAIGSLTLSPFTNRPYDFFKSLLQSSSFTVLWSAATAIRYNPFSINVLTREPFARAWIDRYHPMPIKFRRHTDVFEITRWIQQHMPLLELPRMDTLGTLDEFLELILNADRYSTQGATLITEVILNGVSSEKIESAKDMDADMLHFILIKAIAIYAIGTKRSDTLPSYFKNATRKAIAQLRQEVQPKAVSHKLWQAINQLEEYTEENTRSEKILIKIKEIANGELQQGTFLTNCLKKALEAMPD